MKPQTAAACAVFYAHEEKKHLFAEADPSHPPPTLALEPLAHQVL